MLDQNGTATGSMFGLISIIFAYDLKILFTRLKRVKKGKKANVHATSRLLVDY